MSEKGRTSDGPRFLKRFEEVYGKLGKTDTIVATAVAHHRTPSSTAMAASPD